MKEPILIQIKARTLGIKITDLLRIRFRCINQIDILCQINGSCLYHRIYRTVEILTSVLLLSMIWVVNGDVWLIIVVLCQLMAVVISYIYASLSQSNDILVGLFPTDWIPYLLVYSFNKSEHNMIGLYVRYSISPFLIVMLSNTLKF